MTAMVGVGEKRLFDRKKVGNAKETFRDFHFSILNSFIVEIAI